MKDLDGLIEGFLKDTRTIVPAKNPAFDPKAQMPPIGKQRATRSPGTKKQKTADLRQELERQSDAEAYTSS